MQTAMVTIIQMMMSGTTELILLHIISEFAYLTKEEATSLKHQI